VFDAINYDIQLDVHRYISIISFRCGINAPLLAHLKLQFNILLWRNSKKFCFVVASKQNKSLAGL